MEYTEGKTGRIFVLKLKDNEPIYSSIEEVARKENIRFADVKAVGGIRRGDVVVGPKQISGTIDPMIKHFDDARELVGFGTIAWDDEKPILHFHGSIGRGEETITGCPRVMAETFLILEVVITEILGVDITREFDEETKVKLLSVN